MKEASPVSNTFRTSDGIALAVDFHGGGAPCLVVVSHGIFGNRRMTEIQVLARALVPHFDLVTFDCRGHGSSSGRFTFGKREWRDLADLVESYRRRYDKIAGIGFSFGGFHTCVAGGLTGCFDAVLLVSAPKDFWILDHNPLHGGLWKSFRLMAGRKRTWTRLAPALGRRTMPIDCVGAMGAPVRVLHGDRDWLIHHRHGWLLFEAAVEPKSLDILEGGIHAEYMITQMPARFLGLVKKRLLQDLPPREGADRPGS